MADTGYGQMYAFRAGPAERGLDYVTAVRPDTSADPGDSVPAVPERDGRMGAPRKAALEQAGGRAPAPGDVPPSFRPAPDGRSPSRRHRRGQDASPSGPWIPTPWTRTAPGPSPHAARPRTRRRCWICRDGVGRGLRPGTGHWLPGPVVGTWAGPGGFLPPGPAVSLASGERERRPVHVVSRR
ncbi:transposase [Streptomyces sp. NPDC059568]|uniref:transposase n=1 Tax=Streptomyces sp. NPDC059568 TaxID=3346868 RepID=UPI00367570D5